MPDQPRGQRCSRSRIAEYLPNHMQRTITWLGGGKWGKRVDTLATGAKVVQNSFVGLVEKLSYSVRLFSTTSCDETWKSAAVRQKVHVFWTRLIRKNLIERGRRKRQSLSGWSISKKSGWTKLKRNKKYRNSRWFVEETRGKLNLAVLFFGNL